MKTSLNIKDKINITFFYNINFLLRKKIFSENPKVTILVGFPHIRSGPQAIFYQKNVFEPYFRLVKIM